ncbi:MAG TPA: hypothetical protein VHB68_04820 [Steroidobacteraceae bacterium]|nr:hypothetical protein [Steroidobacteraceae bacterium]
MKYLVITLLALILGALAGRMIWGEKKPEPVDPVQVILTQVRTHAVIEHERQVAVWYRACPQVLGKTPQIFIAWPAKLVYELELGDTQITRTGGVIKVTTAAIHSDEPSVPTDFMDYLSTTSIFTFANEQELVNHEIGKASPIARYLTTYFLSRDPSLADDFADELRSLVGHMAGALGVKYTQIDVEIPKVVIPPPNWPKLPKLELCEGSLAAVNGLPFAKTDGNYTVPIGFRPPPSHRSASGQKAAQSAAPPADAPKGTATILPVPPTAKAPVPAKPAGPQDP